MLKIRTASYLLLLSAFLFADSSALAQPKLVSSNFLISPLPPPPASLMWELATDDGRHVELAIHGIQPRSQQIAYLITQENASEFGVNWEAWKAAAINPEYKRSIMSFGGISKEQPIANAFGVFELDRINIFIMEYQPLFFSEARIHGGLLDLPIVPEPSAAPMFAIGVSIFTAGSTLFRLRRPNWSY